MLDLSQIEPFLQDAISLVNSRLGFDIPPDAARPLALVILAPFVLLTAYLGVRKAKVILRRWRGETNAMDADSKALYENVRVELEKLNGDLHKAVEKNTDKKLSPVFKMLQDKLNSAEDLITASAEEETPEQKLDRNGRMPRRQMIRLVRETVLSNLWAGNYFDESRRRRHEFRATFEDADRKWITINVRTPFALPPQSDDELPYAIDVRHGTRYVMRIQWDPVKHDDIQIQYVIRGSWEDAILSWNVSQQYIPKVPDTDTDEAKTVEVIA
ncbi:MAG: hypothetical protein RIC14_05130 [Filomicrobium sp.]